MEGSLMEPMHPDMRAALKAAHPELTDEVLDRYEALVAQRFQFDPETQEAEIWALDRQREQLVLQHMPNFRQVNQIVSQRRAARGNSPPAP
jgi:hypothetical protein